MSASVRFILISVAVGLLHLPVPVQAQGAHGHNPSAGGVADNTAVIPDTASSHLMPETEMKSMHGDSTNWLLLANRLEFVKGDKFNWAVQGWIGKDTNKLWLKSEGARNQDSHDTDDAELQVLFSHAIHPFWDVQLGLRQDFIQEAAQTHAVLGVMGLAPYWFEVDAALFVGESGAVSARAEAEYDLRLTQRLLLQPRAELNYHANEDAAHGIAQGMVDANIGFRLRYEIVREVAPYIGVEWHHAYGATADALGALGQDNPDLSVVAGVRLWY